MPFREEVYDRARQSFIDSSLSAIDHYRKAGILMEINAETDIETVFKKSATAIQLSLFKDLKVSDNDVVVFVVFVVFVVVAVAVSLCHSSQWNQGPQGTPL